MSSSGSSKSSGRSAAGLAGLGAASRTAAPRSRAWPGCPTGRPWPSCGADLPCPWPSCRAPIPGMPGIAGHPRHAAAGRELAHHLLRLDEALDQRVDVGDRRRPEPRAMRCRREPLRILGSRRSCGVIDWMIAVMRSISRSSMFSICSRICAHARQHPEQLGHRAHLADRLHLRQEVLEGEVLAAAELAGHLLGLVLVEGLLGLLDEGEHVAHAEDARGHPVGVEGVEVVELLAVGREHHLPAGDLRDRQRRATAGVAVELGEHDAVEADAVEERLRGGDRVLADHRVDDEQDLVGVDRVADVGGLLHQLGVDAEPAGGVDDHDVVHLLLGVLDRAAGHRRPGRRRRCRAPGANTGTPARSPTTCSWVTALGRCRSAATSTGWWPCALEPVGQLAGQRRLAGALQAGQHDHRRRGLGEPQPAGLAAEDRDELLVDDLDDLLGRVQRLAAPRRRAPARGPPR